MERVVRPLINEDIARINGEKKKKMSNINGVDKSAFLQTHKREMVRMEFLVAMVMLWLVRAATGKTPPIPKAGCVDSCGSVNIPYPFGIGPNCYANQSFAITCNSSKPFLTSINLEVLEIQPDSTSGSLTGAIRVNSPVTASDDCPARHRGRTTGTHPYTNLTGTPFSFSATLNQLVGIGCNVEAHIFKETTEGTAIFIAGCLSMCDSNTRSRRDGSCNGVNCCHTSIPPSLKVVNVSLSNNDGIIGCKYGLMVEKNWFSHNLTDPYVVEVMENVPVMLDWRMDATCYYTTYGSCACPWGTEGNPYLQNGCQELKCEDGNICQDNDICKNIVGGQIMCLRPRRNRTMKSVVVGIGSALGGLLPIVGVLWLRRKIKRRKKAKLVKKFFKRNGGLLLQQQLCSAEQGYVEKTKLFTSKELEAATDHYNENRILGHGGQGTVYKGMLTDGKIVAVKKSKLVDEGNLEEFINELVILSQINHRNVVNLHGCCLETEVPMLVYEFIPNGTLYRYIHHQQNEDFLLSWDVRLRIASEVAGAISYLHSAASLPIYHRDIKSNNILLDDKYRAKVADFGTSRSATIDQTHMSTRVQGTFGYLDPEYFQSSQFTAKSDVYSFGVVLVELLTGQKAVLPITFEEGPSLVTYFMSSMKKNQLFDILDAQVLEDEKREIVGVANLSRQCLNLKGKNRPTMREVALELEVIRTTHEASPHFQQQYEETDDYIITELSNPLNTASTSAASCVFHGR